MSLWAGGYERVEEGHERVKEGYEGVEEGLLFLVIDIKFCHLYKHESPAPKDKLCKIINIKWLEVIYKDIKLTNIISAHRNKHLFY